MEKKTLKKIEVLYFESIEELTSIRKEHDYFQDTARHNFHLTSGTS